MVGVWQWCHLRSFSGRSVKNDINVTPEMIFHSNYFIFSAFTLNARNLTRLITYIVVTCNLSIFLHISCWTWLPGSEIYWFNMWRSCCMCWKRDMRISRPQLVLNVRWEYDLPFLSIKFFSRILPIAFATSETNKLSAKLSKRVKNCGL